MGEGSEKDSVRQEISRFMDVGRFLQIQRRLEELRGEEQKKLNALSELQKVFVAANSDYERDLVKKTVGDIRELSKTTRKEIRELNEELVQSMPLDTARELYRLFLEAEDK